MNHSNLILMTDSYKTSHFLQMPPKTTGTYFYIEARQGGVWDQVLFFGIQAFIKQYLTTPITKADIDEAEAVFAVHGAPFNRAGWEQILTVHGGFLPLVISAAPEGSVIEAGNILVSITNTCPESFWLPGYIETALLRAIWYPSTVATNSWHAKLAIMRGLNRSCDEPEAQIDFRLHDFGARGVSSSESAALGGMAHLVNFKGTDTVEALLAARRFYGCDMAGFSIPAAEHSTITSWGRDGELEAYRNMLRQFAKPGALVAIVSDSYDLMHAVGEMWGGSLKAEIEASGATVVVRPDSGDPLTVPVDVLRLLDEKFGSTVNAKGYKVLPACIRVIQGDGITAASLPKLIDNVLAAGFSLENLAFGMGGGLLQQVNRDTMRFAMKCSAARIDGLWVDAGKDPVTDHSKRSKKGMLTLLRTVNGYKTVSVEAAGLDMGVLAVVYRHGHLVRGVGFDEVRERAHQAAVDLLALDEAA